MEQSMVALQGSMSVGAYELEVAAAAAAAGSGTLLDDTPATAESISSAVASSTSRFCVKMHPLGSFASSHVFPDHHQMILDIEFEGSPIRYLTFPRVIVKVTWRKGA